LLLLNDLNQAALGSEIDPNAYDQNGANTTRPYYSQFPTYGVIDQLNSSGSSSYSSLQASLRVSNWHGLVSKFSYTWAHTHDYGSFLALPQNSSDPAAEYGNSDFDQRQNLTAYLLYSLPSAAQHLKRLSNG
jgi:hypothetical protein